MIKRRLKAFTIIGGALMIWMIASFLNVYFCHLFDKPVDDEHNFFSIIVKTFASQELAEYEEKKGQAMVTMTPAYSYTEADLELLAHIINAEGGAASYVSDDMCYGIGSVVLNRVESDLYPNTIAEVINQPGQYSSYGSGNWAVPVNDRSYQIAQELLDTGSVLPSNVLFQAEFTQGSGVYMQIQNEYFCYR